MNLNCINYLKIQAENYKNKLKYMEIGGEYANEVQVLLREFLSLWRLR